MKKIIPHITIILSLMTIAFFIIDKFNEIMAFMTSEMSKWLFAVLALCAIITSVCLIRSNLQEEERREILMAKHRRRIQQNADGEEED